MKTDDTVAREVARRMMVRYHEEGQEEAANVMTETWRHFNGWAVKQARRLGIK